MVTSPRDSRNGTDYLFYLSAGAFHLDIEAYLERINYHGSRTLTPQTLRALQAAHLLTVPFENLSIHAGEPIILADDALFDKVVNQRRGGFCYELNGLFAALLRALGFDVAMLSAGVATAAGRFSPDFDHMTLMVSLDERRLVDVGFGDTFRRPLLLDDATVQEEYGRSYRIDADKDLFTLMERKANSEWKAQYRFSLHPYEYADFAGMCHYQQTSPDSHFTQGRVCTRATPEGRVTLSEMKFIVTSLAGDRKERILKNDEAYTKVLQEHFGIIMRE